MTEKRRSLRGSSRAEMAARAAVFDWMQKSLDQLAPSGDPEVMLQIATAFSKMSLAQMKVRQVKGKDEEDEKPVADVSKGVGDLQDMLKDEGEESDDEEDSDNGPK